MEKQKLLQNTISNRILQALYLNGEQTTMELQNNEKDGKNEDSFYKFQEG